MKIFEVLQWGERRLKEAEVENSRWDADLLLSFDLGWRREQLYLERETVLSDEQWKHYQSLIARRSAREPLQYILRNQEFMGLSFYVDERVLIPRADSEILIEKLLEFRKSSAKAEIRIADLCTGSGALAVAIAHFWTEAFVIGTDLSSAALEVARYNAQQNKAQVEWREGDFFEPIRGERWDWIVTNPPYIPEKEHRLLAPEIFKEPEMALVGAENGLIFYRRLAEEAASLLKPEGRILMEIGWDQGQAVQELFQKQGFRTQVFRDYGGRDRVVYAEFSMR
ncbi:peptide chain release factor N(5)-glutamine methyltransferase [Desulfitobacterium metallireducens]|uniref:Release factor glutamine methyltransferase n=1 Tax=Desulfitobacterium metallireducens DSM 15288 TaxID=871968 RepID=W0EGV4_9FIRM|nr:peptide chain release factor N(5)-glutamine methyltransferase [Desulfitobacterium metallireducens]AHF08286.1 N5-glutamine S-adenosyl-L-methionine-dependent methyltransferase [Desulfitobacterium metallireducens DSM 15288]